LFYNDAWNVEIPPYIAKVANFALTEGNAFDEFAEFCERYP
jgi:hypothetical protein